MSQPSGQTVSFVKENLDRTSQQVTICLQAVTTLERCLCVEEWHEDAVVIPGKERELEGGCPAAAAVAFIAVCDRLRDIVRDDSRFTKEAETNGAIASVLAANAAAVAASNATELAAQLSASPHAQLRPMLHRLPEGGWAALYGDPSKPDTCVLGKGATPAEALLDFDKAMHTPNQGKK